MKITTQCPFCHRITPLEVPEDGFRRWQDGELIQNALPNLTATEREALITGICDKCWDETFGEPR